MKLGVAILLGLVALSACDEGVRSEAAGSFSCSPESFTFPSIAAGETISRTVEVVNEGREVLKLAHFNATFSSGHTLSYIEEAEPVVHEVYAQGEMSFPKVISIEPAGALTFVLEYTAPEDSAQSGKLMFETNDPDKREVTIPVVATGGSPEVVFTPDAYDFGRVAAGNEVSGKIQLSNGGKQTLFLESFTLYGDQSNINRFKVTTLNGADVTSASTDLSDLDGDGVPGISAGKAATLKVAFKSETEDPSAVTLAVRSNDPVTPEASLSLSANGASPCIEVVPSELNFTGSALYTQNTLALDIRSCGLQPLHIYSFEMKEGSAPEFSLSPQNPVAPFALPAAQSGLGDSIQSMNVRFTPRTTDTRQGVVVIETNDPLKPHIEVLAYGDGVENFCPLAEAHYLPLEVSPLQFLTLDGSRSTDGDGRVVRWDWSVVSRPEGSTSKLAESYLNINQPMETAVDDDPSTPTAKFYVDQPGTYVFDLKVTDDQGTEAPSERCRQSNARVTIEALPDSAIAVQLRWHNAIDADEDDQNGSDVDLHMRRPGTKWKAYGASASLQPRLSCSAQNRQPDWGPTGPEGNPVLAKDDTDGGGPEGIRLQLPEITSEIGGPYEVGAYYYRGDTYVDTDNYWGEAQTTMTVFIKGELAGTFTGTLASTGAWWIGAAIDWDGENGTVQALNRTYASTPANNQDFER